MRRSGAGGRVVVAVVTVLVLGARCAEAQGDALQTLEAVLPSYLLESAEDLVKAASAACDLLPLEAVFSGQVAGAAVPPLEMVEVDRTGSQVSMRLSTAHRRVRARRSTARAGTAPQVLVYVPGWWNTPQDSAARALLSALLPHHPAPLVLDTRPAFCRGYLSAAARVHAVSRQLYSFIENLDRVGVPPSAVHVVGFSLGAHVAGITGKLVKKHMNMKLDRITALDPAKPCFGVGTGSRLHRGDAGFVQVVHSSAGVLGLMEPVGHADVYVNGVAGKQPECRHRKVSFECDHNRAWRVFAASASDARALTGRRCRSWRELEAGSCSGEVAVLGYNCSNRSRGIYLYKSPSDRFDGLSHVS